MNLRIEFALLKGWQSILGVALRCGPGRLQDNAGSVAFVAVDPGIKLRNCSINSLLHRIQIIALSMETGSFPCPGEVPNRSRGGPEQVRKGPKEVREVSDACEAAGYQLIIE